MIFHWSLSDSILRSPGLFSLFWPILITLDGLDSSSDFQLFLPPYQAFEDRSKRASYNWYHRYSQVPQFFSSLARSKYFSLFAFIFSLCGRLGRQNPRCNFSFFLLSSIGLIFWLGLEDQFVSQNPSEFYASHFPRRIPVGALFGSIVKFPFLAQFPVDHLGPI